MAKKKEMKKAGDSKKTSAKTSTQSKTATATKTSTSTKAYTQGNITVTGGAGKGSTKVSIGIPGLAGLGKKANKSKGKR